MIHFYVAYAITTSSRAGQNKKMGEKMGKLHINHLVGELSNPCVLCEHLSNSFCEFLLLILGHTSESGKCRLLNVTTCSFENCLHFMRWKFTAVKL